MKALIVQTAFLGDVVFTSALVGSLALRFPEAELELCVAPRGRDVALAIPGVARVHVFDKRGLDRGARAVSGFVSSADARVAWWIGGALRPLIEWPARALQWVQSGDVQWYIGVALFSLLAMIAAFMKGV